MPTAKNISWKEPRLAGITDWSVECNLAPSCTATDLHILSGVVLTQIAEGLVFDAAASSCSTAVLVLLGRLQWVLHELMLLQLSLSHL